jgi:cell division protein FtsW
LVVSGIIVWLVAQSFLNIGAIVGLLPLTGVPLPFVSHGGTALMMALAGVGLIANISKHS